MLIISSTIMYQYSWLSIPLFESLHTWSRMGNLELRVNSLPKGQTLSCISCALCSILLNILILKLTHMLNYLQVNQASVSYMQAISIHPNSPIDLKPTHDVLILACCCLLSYLPTYGILVLDRTLHQQTFPFDIAIMSVSTPTMCIP